MNLIDNAVNLLNKFGYSLVLTNGKDILTSTDRGIKPLLDIVEKYQQLKGYTAADIIIGKAASMLYALLGVKEVYGKVMSKSALEILERYHIQYSYEVLTDNIINRMGTDLCPMEKAVKDIDDIQEGYLAIKKKVESLRK